MTVEKGVRSWKSVRGCSVEVEESAEEPTSFSETIVMTQVYASGSGIETGWAALIALVAFLVVSCGVRFARDDRCMICGHRLIWFLKVCSPCRFYGYDLPSKDVMEIIREKRSVVLPEPTLSERIGTVKASTTKVFVQATEGLLSTTRFASTRFAQKERPPNSANPRMREGEGADGSPQRNENSPDLHGDTASANCSGKEGTGSGRRSGDNTRTGGSRGRGAIESTGIARGVSLSRGGTSLSASPARGRVGTDTKTYSDLPAVGTDGTDGKGANRTAVLRPVFIRS